MQRYSFLKPGEGVSYDWSMDHTFVKVSTADTGGAFCLMEDNLKAHFALGLHLHRQHAETFYLLEGDVDFYIDGEWMTAMPGTTIHIPPGVPHAVLLTGAQTAKMLMIFQPAGFDQFLALMRSMPAEELADEAGMAALSERFDIISLGPVPPRP